MKTMKNSSLKFISIVCLGLIFTGLHAQNIQDIENNSYDTLTIGAQTWMKTNLKVTKFNDGTAIPMVKENTDWAMLSAAAYCWYNNDETMYKNTYGALYNFWVVDAKSNGGKNVCPAGWHVPTNDEWTILINFLGGEAYSGGKLKDTLNWKVPNKGATNESGFGALPVGGRDNFGKFNSIGEYGWWWSSTETDATNAMIQGLGFDFDGVGRGADSKKWGDAVRCLKDVDSK
jgi:uncharacterized protein (TIGR02145 family)